MTINYSSILKDLLTWASAAKLVGGAFVHRVYVYLKAKFMAAEAAVVAEAKKL